MRKAPRGRSLQALVVASCLLASLSAAGGELRLERVTLSVEQRSPRDGARVEEGRGPLPPEGVVLPLRVVDPGRLVVTVGEQRLTDCHLGFGEAGALLLAPLEDDSPLALPRVVNREPGKEEVEVHLAASGVAGQRLVLTYEWGWKHEGKPPLVRTWHLPAPARGTGLAAFEHNGKASLQRALDSLEPLVASPAGQGLAATVRALREDLKRAFFDVSRVHDAPSLERTLRLREELQRLWPPGTERPKAASSALSDLLLVVLSSALAEHRSLSVLPGDGEDLIKVGHVASHGPDRVLRTGPFIDVLEVKAFGNVGLSHLGKWIVKRTDPKNPGKFLYEFDGNALDYFLDDARQPALRDLLDDHTLRYHLFIYAPDTALTRELVDLFTGTARSIPIKGIEGAQIILTMTRHWD